MSDPWNAVEADTPHGKAESYQSRELDEPVSSFDKLYREGIDALGAAGFMVELSPQGAHCGHNIYSIAKPRAVNGIHYPGWFRVKRLVETAEEEAVIAATITYSEKMSSEAKAFWMPLTNPKSGSQVSELSGYVERLIKVQAAFMEQHEDEPFSLGISWHPGECIKAYPRAYIPEREWFAESLQSLKFTDIFTLWPEAEARMLQLILGRVVVGRSNHIPCGREEAISHTFRSAAIIVGEDPGLGKSTTFNMLFNALIRVGYRRSNFRSLSDRFNLGKVITSDVAYKDDLVVRTLKQLLSEEATKTIVSGGQLFTEDKFSNGVNQWANSVVIANTNEFDPRVAYSLDPGIVDRMKLLSTYRRSEMDKLTEVSESPDLQPAIHIPWLAEQHGVEEAAVILWAMRLAADYFDSLITGNLRTNKLADEVHLLTSKLRLQFNKDVTRQTLSAVHLLDVLYNYTSSGLTKNTPVELSKAHLHKALTAFGYLAVNRDFYRMRSLIKRHWELNGRKDNHPWVGLRKLNFGCVRYVLASSHDAISANVQLNTYVSEVFSQFTYRDGFAGSKDIVWVTKSWESVRYEDEVVTDLAAKVWRCMQAHSDEFRISIEAMLTKHGLMNDDYLQTQMYSPQLIGRTEGEFNELVNEGVFDEYLR